VKSRAFVNVQSGFGRRVKRAEESTNSTVTLDKMHLFVILFDSEVEKQLSGLKRRPQQEEVLRKKLGTRLRDLRKKAGLKRREVAELLGKRSETLISYYESGKHLPPVEYIDLLAERLNLKKEEVHELKSILHFLKLLPLKRKRSGK